MMEEEVKGPVSVIVTKTKKKKANSIPNVKKKKKKLIKRDTLKPSKSPSTEKKKKKKKDGEKKPASASSSPSPSQIKYTSAIRGEDWMDVYQKLKDRVWQDKPKEEWKVLEMRAIGKALESSTEKRSKIGSSPKNKPKNRYTTILPYDENRVKLSKEIDGSDYINASLLTTSGALKMKRPLRYVAASAPIPSTIESWYRMIWELEIVIIVMLTECMEGNKEKCTKYWPEVGEELTYGSTLVKNIKQETNEHLSLVMRTLAITCDGQTKEAIQFHYLAWPDHEIPKTPESLEAVIKNIDTTYKKTRRTKDSPVLVHCSAGVGRTGTFIVIQSLFHLVEYSMKKSKYVPPRKGSAVYLGRSISCDNARDSDIIVRGDDDDYGFMTSKFGSIIASNRRLSDNPSPEDIADSNGSEESSSPGGSKRKNRRPPTINIKRLVQHIRDQRASMLTRPEQYEFCYKSLLGFLAKKLSIPPVDYQGVGHLLQGTTVIALRPRKLFLPGAKLAPNKEEEKDNAQATTTES